MQVTPYSSPNNDSQVVTQAKIDQGVGIQHILEVANLYNVRQQDIADILGVSVRSIQKRRGSGRETLDKNLTERILTLRELMEIAVTYFGCEKSAQEWFQQNNRGLGDVNPFALCDSFLGMARVRNSIMKFTYGMTA